MQPQYRFIPLHSFVCLSLHCITLPAALYHFTPFQQYNVCRPLFFQRLLLRPAIGVWRRFPHFYHFIEASLFNYQLSIINYQLVQLLCPKSRYACGCPLFFPRRFTLLSLLSIPQAPLRSRSSVAVRLPQPRHCAPHSFRYNSASASF